MRPGAPAKPRAGGYRLEHFMPRFWHEFPCGADISPPSRVLLLMEIAQQLCMEAAPRLPAVTVGIGIPPLQGRRHRHRP
ncbi:hypothetical protein GUJ93_ZPchr0001g29923 [Zizania palustris]|uniref:Uncharacterized protein n=1 Tax=Zizania palustris TaxID=103762 RepID=A0A8J5VAN3_ZIZPA|nr:hypothetical protein GUJ93_ZPchr0001g29923 [Zizania palustris]